MAEISFDPAAAQEYVDRLEQIGSAVLREMDDASGIANAATGRFTRLQTAAEQQVANARNRLSAAEGRVHEAEESLRSASSPDDDQEANPSAIAAAQQQLAATRSEQAEAEAALDRAEAIVRELGELWGSHVQPMMQAQAQAAERQAEFAKLRTDIARDLNLYAEMMNRARLALHEGGTGAAASGSSASGGSAGSSSASAGSFGAHSAPGWCPKNSMSAVSIGADGTKQITMTIGGESVTVPCTKAGIASAYQRAVACGDQNMIERTSAMFEIETLREDLELTGGTAGEVQLGGYHRDVQAQDPPGYESHHIPARSVQDENAGWLPAISISNEDHSHTSSYRGRQQHVYQPFIPSPVQPETYKQEVSSLVSEGGSGYIRAVRNELYDLRSDTGHKYDSGISGLLDAYLDMFARRGIPGNR